MIAMEFSESEAFYMTLLQLQYFLSLAKSLHYTKTSEQLHISQPSLSYEIRELEKSLGVPLFDRRKRRIALTDEGRAFLPYAEKALSTLEKGSDLLRRMGQKKRGEIRLGYFHSVATPLIPDLVDGFYEEYGKETLFRFTESNSREISFLLQNGELDLAFTPEPVDGMESVSVIRQPLFCCVNEKHSFSGKSFLEFSEICGEPQILLEEGSNLRSITDSCFAEYDTIPNAVLEVKECNSAIQYVAMNFGVAVLPAVPAMESSKVRAIPLFYRGKALERSVYLDCRDESQLSDSARLFRDYVLSHAPSQQI